jgi:hypothetical protein
VACAGLADGEGGGGDEGDFVGGRRWEREEEWQGISGLVFWGDQQGGAEVGDGGGGLFDPVERAGLVEGESARITTAGERLVAVAALRPVSPVGEGVVGKRSVSKPRQLAAAMAAALFGQGRTGCCGGQAGKAHHGRSGVSRRFGDHFADGGFVVDLEVEGGHPSGEGDSTSVSTFSVWTVTSDSRGDGVADLFTPFDDNSFGHGHAEFGHVDRVQGHGSVPFGQGSCHHAVGGGDDGGGLMTVFRALG